MEGSAASVFVDPIVQWVGPWAAGINIRSLLLRLFLAMLLGAVIGWERSNKRHSAGLRTFMLTFLIGALAGILDSYLFAESGKTGLFLFSAAAVIGAAIIAVHSLSYSSRSQIKGLTTAVGLWAAILIGIALGLGFYTVALATFAALLCALLWFPPLEIFFKNRSNHFEVHLG